MASIIEDCVIYHVACRLATRLDRDEAGAFRRREPVMTPIPDCQTSCYSLEIQESVAIIRFTGDIYELGACLGSKDAFMSTIGSLSRSPEIRVLLLLNSPGVLGDENYCSFVSNAIKARAGGADRQYQGGAYSDDPILFERMTNTLNQFVCEILAFGKLLIVGFEGDVAPPFFGVGLAADYRYGTDEMTFHPSHMKLGIPPGGGLGFLLPRFIGHGKTRDLLLSDKPTSARELHRLGLLDDHLPCDGFRNECINMAKDLAKMPPATITGTKAVINFSSRDLPEFLQYEDKITARTIVQMLSQKR
ncbi:hypothetical protein DRQ50_10425 [bacterium]|nr:MAG: hypothetical protein DRQ50_10425 [bacterium]